MGKGLRGVGVVGDLGQTLMFVYRGIENKKGRLKTVDRDVLRLNILPRGKASVSRAGIKFKGLSYSSDKAISQQWFIKSTVRSIEIVYDPRNVSEIYIPHDNGLGYEECYLLEVSNQYKDCILEEIIFNQEFLAEVADEKVINERMSHIRSTADSLSVIGISGIGKTTAIERLLLMYPQIIKHNEYEGQHFSRSQIVWLKIDCPYDGSLATLCKSFFKAIDDLLGTRYLEKFGYANRITSTMMLHMTTLAGMYGIGVLVIDEMQHLLNAKNDMEGMLDFFVTLSNTVGIPTVLIGTSKAQQLFKGNFKQARRAGSEGSIMWDRMLKNSEEWKFFLETLWDFQCLQEETKLSKEIKEAFYDECQGITAVAVNLYILAQERALAQGKEKISVGVIRDTAKEDLYMIQPMIKALRNNNILEIVKYEDISINLDDIAINYKSDMELNGRVREVFNERKKSIELVRRSKVENLIFDLRLMDLFENLDDVEIKKICERVVNESSVNEEYSSLKMEALKKALEQEEKKKHNNNKIKKNETKNQGLITLYDKARKDKVHPYDVLKKNGYIKDPIEEFLKVE
ncbi:AAA family ATPase [Clostridium sp.]|uniref:AAA family ATPase n=1 Tax=Clostridium sp. TaxID=1506 RepID=UPI003D6CF8A8